MTTKNAHGSFPRQTNQSPLFFFSSNGDPICPSSSLNCAGTHREEGENYSSRKDWKASCAIFYEYTLATLMKKSTLIVHTGTRSGLRYCRLHAVKAHTSLNRLEPITTFSAVNECHYTIGVNYKIGKTATLTETLALRDGSAT